LWAPSSPSAAASTASYYRVSPHALCVISLGSEAAHGLEQLPVKDLKSRCVVLFDASVAALGGFQTLHSPQLLQQIGEQFRHHQETTPTASGGATTAFVETVGFYTLYVPFVALLTVATAFQHFVQDVQTPLWLVVGGGKSLAVRRGFSLLRAGRIALTSCWFSFGRSSRRSRRRWPSSSTTQRVYPSGCVISTC